MGINLKIGANMGTYIDTHINTNTNILITPSEKRNKGMSIDIHANGIHQYMYRYACIDSNLNIHRQVNISIYR